MGNICGKDHTQAQQGTAKQDEGRQWTSQGSDLGPAFSVVRRSPADAWLKELGLNQYAAAFNAAGYSDWQLLGLLEESDLQMIERHGKVAILPGHRKKLLLASKQMSQPRTPSKGTALARWRRGHSLEAHSPRSLRLATARSAPIPPLRHAHTNRVTPLHSLLADLTPLTPSTTSSARGSAHHLSRDNFLHLSKELIEPLQRTTSAQLQRAAQLAGLPLAGPAASAANLRPAARLAGLQPHSYDKAMELLSIGTSSCASSITPSPGAGQWADVKCTLGPQHHAQADVFAARSNSRAGHKMSGIPAVRPSTAGDTAAAAAAAAGVADASMAAPGACVPAGSSCPAPVAAAAGGLLAQQLGEEQAADTQEQQQQQQGQQQAAGASLRPSLLTPALSHPQFPIPQASQLEAPPNAPAAAAAATTAGASPGPPAVTQSPSPPASPLQRSQARAKPGKPHSQGGSQPARSPRLPPPLEGPGAAPAATASSPSSPVGSFRRRQQCWGNEGGSVGEDRRCFSPPRGLSTPPPLPGPVATSSAAVAPGLPPRGGLGPSGGGAIPALTLPSSVPGSPRRPQGSFHSRGLLAAWPGHAEQHAGPPALGHSMSSPDLGNIRAQGTRHAGRQGPQVSARSQELLPQSPAPQAHAAGPATLITGQPQLDLSPRTLRHGAAMLLATSTAPSRLSRGGSPAHSNTPAGGSLLGPTPSLAHAGSALGPQHWGSASHMLRSASSPQSNHLLARRDTSSTNLPMPMQHAGSVPVECMQRMQHTDSVPVECMQHMALPGGLPGAEALEVAAVGAGSNAAMQQRPQHGQQRAAAWQSGSGAAAAAGDAAAAVAAATVPTEVVGAAAVAAMPEAEAHTPSSSVLGQPGRTHAALPAGPLPGAPVATAAAAAAAAGTGRSRLSRWLNEKEPGSVGEGSGPPPGQRVVRPTSAPSHPAPLGHGVLEPSQPAALANKVAAASQADSCQPEAAAQSSRQAGSQGRLLHHASPTPCAGPPDGAREQGVHEASGGSAQPAPLPPIGRSGGGAAQEAEGAKSPAQQVSSDMPTFKGQLPAVMQPAQGQPQQQPQQSAQQPAQLQQDQRPPRAPAPHSEAAAGTAAPLSRKLSRASSSKGHGAGLPRRCRSELRALLQDVERLLTQHRVGPSPAAALAQAQPPDEVGSAALPAGRPLQSPQQQQQQHHAAAPAGAVGGGRTLGGEQLLGKLQAVLQQLALVTGVRQQPAAATQAATAGVLVASASTQPATTQAAAQGAALQDGKAVGGSQAAAGASKGHTGDGTGDGSAGGGGGAGDNPRSGSQHGPTAAVSDGVAGSGPAEGGAMDPMQLLAQQLHLLHAELTARLQQLGATSSMVMTGLTAGAAGPGVAAAGAANRNDSGRTGAVAAGRDFDAGGIMQQQQLQLQQQRQEHQQQQVIRHDVQDSLAEVESRVRAQLAALAALLSGASSPAPPVAALPEPGQDGSPAAGGVLSVVLARKQSMQRRQPSAQ